MQTMYSRAAVVRQHVDNFRGGVPTKQCKKNVYANYTNSKASCYDDSISVYLYIIRFRLGCLRFSLDLSRCIMKSYHPRVKKAFFIEMPFIIGTRIILRSQSTHNSQVFGALVFKTINCIFFLAFNVGT